MLEFDYERRCLENGVVLLFHRTRRVPLVSLGVLLRCGKDQNPLHLPGLSNLTARLLDEGTVRHSELEIAAMVESVGGRLSIFSDREFSGVEVEVRSRDLVRGVRLMAELVREPVFPEDRLELERVRLLTQLRSLQDDPFTVGSHELSRRIFQGTPLAEPTLGTPDSVSRVSRQEIADFYRLKYGPSGAAVVAVGDVAAEDFFQAAEAAFGDWTNPEFRLDPVVVPPSGRAATRRLPAVKEQVHVFLGGLGMERRNPDYYAAQIMDVILGGGPGLTSRIPRRVRDELGLAYSVFADLAGSAGRYPGRFVAYAATSPELEQEARDAILGEISRFLDAGPTSDELATARSFLTGSFGFELQSNGSVLRLLLGLETYGLQADFLGRYPELLAAVGCEDVLRVARTYLDPLHFVTVLVGPVVQSS
jgi:zinc protease